MVAAIFFRIFTTNLKIKVMSHLGNDQLLEYFYEQGIAQGMTEEQAAIYAEDEFENYYI